MSNDTFPDLDGGQGTLPKGQKATEMPGSLGGYTLVKEIGAGGMGTVFEAEQVALKRRVALKILLPHLSMGHSAVQLFAREGEAAGRQKHPNIVAIFDIGEENGVHYIAQELVPGGRTLKSKVDDLRLLNELPSDHYQQLARLFIKCASALQHAHDSGVVHRDVKPANILMTPDDEPKVTDFGLAMVEDALSLSRTGQLAGTPYYMSPEQAASRRIGIDHRSDIFSLGVTLYEALTFSRAFAGDTSQQVLEKILLDDPVEPCKVRSRIPVELSAICLKAMEKKREHRYESMAAFGADLQRYLDNEPIRAKPPGVMRRTLKWMRRHPVLGSVGAVILVALGVVSALVVQLDQERQIAIDAGVKTEAALWEARSHLASDAAAGSSLAAMRTSLLLDPKPDRVESQAIMLSKSQPMVIPVEGKISSWALSPGGEITLLLKDGSLMQTINLETGELLDSQDTILATGVQTTSDGQYTVVHSIDGFQVTERSTNSVVYQKEMPDNKIYSVAISHDNRLIATGHENSTINLWNLLTGEKIDSVEWGDELWVQEDIAKLLDLGGSIFTPQILSRIATRVKK